MSSPDSPLHLSINVPYAKLLAAIGVYAWTKAFPENHGR